LALIGNLADVGVVTGGVPSPWSALSSSRIGLGALLCIGEGIGDTTQLWGRVLGLLFGAVLTALERVLLARLSALDEKWNMLDEPEACLSCACMERD
jgi:hypothetical protein